MKFLVAMPAPLFALMTMTASMDYTEVLISAPSLELTDPINLLVGANISCMSTLGLKEPS